MPWPVDLEPEEAAEEFSFQWEAEFGKDHAFDLCFCGMGGDCHTLSLFPQSPLFDEENDTSFAAVQVEERGWRLTLTPQGLEKCRQIIVAVTGSSKAAALKSLFAEPRDERERPAQVFARMANRVIWLVDPDAAWRLSEIEFFAEQMR